MPTAVRSILESIKILAVDDHADTRKMLEIFLERSGAEVTVVESGQAALDLIQKQKPDVLLCDINMPKMDGFELLQKIHALEPAIRSVPAIACTAFGNKEDRARTQIAGFQAHLTKPLDLKTLVTTIVDVIRSPPETEAT